MGYIQPNSDIKLINNCPLDPDYTHTLFFASKNSQASYLLTKVKYSFSNYTYQRYDKGIIRVQQLADNLYDINYMMFRNTNYGNKWFYAFVDSVEYINDNTTAIHYHIDEIQTWLFDWEFNQCFIERQHTSTDEIGDNIVTEPVEVGEYVYNNYAPMNLMNDRAIIVAISDVDEDDEYVADGEVYDGIYGACQYFAYSADTTGVQLINQKINEYKKYPDAIVTIYMLPRDAINSGYINTNTKLPYGSSGVSFLNQSLDDVGTDVDGYKPKNNKLFTFPYNFQNITNGNGSNLALRYEFFANNTAKVNIYTNISQPVQVICTPTKYKGTPYSDEGILSYTPLMDEKITLEGYPQCSWNVDSWKAWISQNSIPVILNTLSAGASVALAMYNPSSITKTVEPISGITRTKTTPANMGGNLDKNLNAGLYALHTITNTLTSIYKASIQADQTKGNVMSSNAGFANGLLRFWHGRMSVNKQQAEIIDNFFSRYGYAINKIGTPSYHTRANWTYVKTVDCTIHGNIPVDSESIIEQCFNSGITFWTNPLHVADYSQPNAPIPTN